MAPAASLVVGSGRGLVLGKWNIFQFCIQVKLGKCWRRGEGSRRGRGLVTRRRLVALCWSRSISSLLTGLWPDLRLRFNIRPVHLRLPGCHRCCGVAARMGLRLRSPRTTSAYESGPHRGPCSMESLRGTTRKFMQQPKQQEPEDDELELEQLKLFFKLISFVYIFV